MIFFIMASSKLHAPVGLQRHVNELRIAAHSPRASRSTTTDWLAIFRFITKIDQCKSKDTCDSGINFARKYWNPAHA